MIRLTHSTRLLLAVLSIFLVGAVAGVALDRTMLIPPHAAAGEAGVPRHHEEVLAELRTELGLSAEQSARVQQIFAAHQGEINEAWAKVHADIEHAMQQTTSEIETVLDPAQIERLHAWLAERHGLNSGHAHGREH